MSRMRKILLDQYRRVGWDNEALWSLLWVLLFVVVLEVYSWAA